MVRGKGQKAAVVLLSLLVFVGVFAGSIKTNAAGQPAPKLDVESLFMSRVLAEQYGLRPEDFTPLRQAGMKWNEIRDYLEQLYPRPKEIRLSTKDYVDLARRTGITPVEAIKAYELALRYRLDPVWLGSLKKEVGSWEKITAALHRFWKAQSRVAEEASRALKPPHEVAPRVLSDVYGVRAVDVEQQLQAGIEPKVLLDLLFLADLRDDAGRLVSRVLPDRWKGKDKTPPVQALHQPWTMRKFPSHLLPLKPPPGWKSPSVPPGQPATAGVSGPTVFPGMPPFQLGGEPAPSPAPASSWSPWPESPWSLDSRTNTGTPEVQGIATPMSSPSPAPSIYDPGVLYGTERVSPFKAYFDGFSEKVDPGSGALIIRQTDFVLPGRNGLDLAFTRVYNSQQANMALPRVEVDATFLGYYFNGGSYVLADEENPIYSQDYPWGYESYIYYHFSYSSQFSYDGAVSGTLNIQVIQYRYYIPTQGYAGSAEFWDAKVAYHILPGIIVTKKCCGLQDPTKSPRIIFGETKPKE